MGRLLLAVKHAIAMPVAWLPAALTRGSIVALGEG